MGRTFASCLVTWWEQYCSAALSFSAKYRLGLGVGYAVAFLLASALTLAAQPGNPTPTPVQLPTAVSVVYSFSSTTSYVVYTNHDGAFCSASLIQDASGKLYGVAPSGGDFGGGTMFSIRTDGSGFTVLHTFSAFTGRPISDGSKPTGVILGTDGWLYGTTAQGGTNAFGTIFRLSTDGVTFANLHNFAANDGQNPQGGLVQGPDGTLYGTAQNGGTNGSGTIFRLNPDGTVFAVLYHFTALNTDTNVDGTQPSSGLILGNDGTLYGAARYGGPSGSIRALGPSLIGSGTLFSIKTNGTAFTVIHAFTKFSGDFLEPTNGDGASPSSALLMGQDGRLYGTAPEAGLGGSGVLFRLDPDGSNFTALHAFNYVSHTMARDTSYGLYPYGGLTEGGDGLLYGAAYGGGYFPNGGYFAGTLYRLHKDGSNLALLHSFAGKNPLTETNADGANPLAGLLQANDGKFYGLTRAGGPYASGTLFSFAPPVLLQMSTLNSFVVLSWPASATNFVLETSNTAGTDSDWTPLTNSIITVSNSFCLTLSPNRSDAFFRLHQR